MKREEVPPEHRDEVVFIKESPAERTFFGFMTILIGLGVFGCVVITVIGIRKSGDMNFYVRMLNTLKSWRSDYYDIRTDIPENDTIIIGTPLSRTTPDVRRVMAELKECSSCGSFMPGAYGKAKHNTS